MLSKTSLFFIGAVFAVASVTAQHILPFDLIDEAEEQLNQLQTLVQGEILAAHDDLSNIVTEFGTNSANVANSGAVDLEQERQTVLRYLTSIKDLAHSAGKDVSSCTEVREQTLSRLPQRYEEQMAACISQVDDEVKRVAENAKYIVDVAFNTVRQYEFELRRCREELLCISPILQQIELDKIKLPQNIKTEVQAADSVVTTLKLTTKSCSDDKVAQYKSEVFPILKNIQACVNRILG